MRFRRFRFSTIRRYELTAHPPISPAIFYLQGYLSPTEIEVLVLGQPRTDYEVSSTDLGVQIRFASLSYDEVCNVVVRPKPATGREIK